MKTRVLVLMLLAVLVAGIVPVAAQDGPVITIWADDTRAEPLREIGVQFEEENGIAVEVLELPFDEIREQFTTAAPNGEGADIIVGANDWLGELTVNGLLEPVDLGDGAENFLPAALDAFSLEGTLYGVPYAVENVAFFRNPELVPDAPATWDEVRAISEELVSNGDAQYGYIIQENDPYHFYGIQSAFGGYIFGINDDGTYDVSDIGVGSEGSIEAISWLEAHAQAELMPAGLEYDSMHSLFESGDAAMMITGPWALERIQESGVSYEISAIPGTAEGENGAPFIGVQGFMVSSFSENTALASLFLTNYVATDDVMGAIFAAGSRPAAYIPVREGVEDTDLLAFGEAGANGQPIPSIPQMGSVWTPWGNAIELVVQGQAEAATAFEDAAAQIAEAVME
ncbi:MAG: maltose ABC transporter substrate-binding protein [Chloroflexota bacterium]